MYLKKSKFKFLFWITLSAIILLELFLRFGLGFCDAVLMVEDNNFEYIAQPDQSRIRFGNHIIYNSESMRSPAIDVNATKILGFGDSILNGGSRTDQEELATTLLSNYLSDLTKSPLQFLNISAGSWGPDNAFAYLKNNGDFKASKIYLVVSSHDAADHMDFVPVVGINPSFPEKQYAMALMELWDRYIITKLWASQAIPEENSARNNQLNSGFASFHDYTSSHDIPFTVVLHAELSELRNKTYNDKGQRIIEFTAKHGITLLRDLGNGLKEEHFKDNIHLNKKGQAFLAELILRNERRLN